MSFLAREDLNKERTDKISRKFLLCELFVGLEANKFKMKGITMKKLLTLLFVLSLSSTSIAFAQETIQKTYCMSSIGYKSNIDDLKKELLNNAKRDAVNELFGELIKSFTKVENFKLTEDKVKDHR